MHSTVCRAALGAAILVSLASGAAWAAAQPIDPEALAAPALAKVKRIGVASVGAETADTAMATDLLVRSLKSAGHDAVPLDPLEVEPDRTTVLKTCAQTGLDAVALVRISTRGPDVHVDVELRDTNGDLLRLVALQSGQHGMVAQRELRLSFSFERTPTGASADGGENPLPDDRAPAPNPDDSLLWFHGNAPYLGTTPLYGSRWYKLVGRPDLATKYDQREAGKVVLGILGGASMAVGATILLADLFVAIFESTVCTVVQGEANLLSGMPVASSGCAVGPSPVLPLILLGAGAGLLVGSVAISPDPVSREERLRLARDYNRDHLDGKRPPSGVSLSFSIAPNPIDGGGMVLIGGRF